MKTGEEKVSERKGVQGGEEKGNLYDDEAKLFNSTKRKRESFIFIIKTKEETFVSLAVAEDEGRLLQLLNWLPNSSRSGAMNP